MACGLPVIVSAENGTVEIITDEIDGMILKDATDARSLAALIRRLFEDAEFRTRLGRKASETARQFSWERNGKDLAQIFEKVLQQKSNPPGKTLAPVL
jgi:glycosyltransferase involved in cell wall biosynthesis